ncbi:MAG: hypothetical protein ABR957_03365 [Terracidiphilus sp.]|jgi:hypothetical protein
MRKTADREPDPGNSAPQTPQPAPPTNPCSNISVPHPFALYAKGWETHII